MPRPKRLVGGAGFCARFTLYSLAGDGQRRETRIARVTEDEAWLTVTGPPRRRDRIQGMRASSLWLSSSCSR